MADKAILERLNTLKMNGNHFFEIAQNAFTNPNSKEEALATYNLLMKNLDELEKELEANDLLNLAPYSNELDLAAASELIRGQTSSIFGEQQELFDCAKSANNHIKPLHINKQ